MSLILDNISKSFDNKKVLDNFSYTFKEGFYCLMGESGSGKTTLLNIIMGLVAQDSGTVAGLENKKISAVFQENRLCENINAIKNVSLVCEKATCEKEIINLLSLLGLSEDPRKPVSKYSGGMKRRVAIARALLNPADIYLFDEPLKELDDELKSM